MSNPAPSYRGYRFPSDIISHAVSKGLHSFLYPTLMLRFEKRSQSIGATKFAIKAQKTGLFTGSHRFG